MIICGARNTGKTTFANSIENAIVLDEPKTWDYNYSNNYVIVVQNLSDVPQNIRDICTIRKMTG